MKLSVIMPAYNAERYIELAICSIVNQHVAVHEVIVIDDGSTDRTVNTVISLQHQYANIRLLQQKNRGVSSARNYGISEANGDWLLFLDADDVVAPTIVEKYLQENANERYDLMYSQYIQINEDGDYVSEAISGTNLEGKDGFCSMLIRNPIISPSGLLAKASIVSSVKGFDESLSYGEDVDLWLRLLLQEKRIGFVNLPLSFIRRHTSNTTANIELTKHNEKKLLTRYNLDMVKQLFYERKHAIEFNQLDYMNILMRFSLWNETKSVMNETKVSPDHVRYASFLFIKAVIALHEEEYQLALRLFEEIKELQPNHGAALNNIGVLYAKLDAKSIALSHINLALKFHPAYMDAIHNLEQLKLGTSEFIFTYRELREQLLIYS